MKRVFVAIIILMVNSALAEGKLEKIIPCSNYTNYITKDAANNVYVFNELNNKTIYPDGSKWICGGSKKSDLFLAIRSGLPSDGPTMIIGDGYGGFFVYFLLNEEQKLDEKDDVLIIMVDKHGITKGSTTRTMAEYMQERYKWAEWLP